ncbi:hypothetical protein CDIK_1521 [Cucumispora dikerogammari]|nr:hypothetical protein CDIK_1521 [Cucumispora dikerogammari]
MNIKNTIKDLQNACKKKEFHKLKVPLLYLHNKLQLTAAKQNNDLVLVNKVKNEIKQTIKDEIKSTLLSQQQVDSVLLSLIYLLGTEFYLEIKEMILFQTLLKYHTLLKIVFPIITNMNDIAICVKKLEETINNLILSTNRYEKEWNVPGIFVFQATTYLKQQITDFIFKKGVDENFLVDVLNRVILYEKRVLKRYFINDCCNPSYSKPYINTDMCLMKQKENMKQDENTKIIKNIKQDANKKHDTDKYTVIAPYKQNNITCLHRKMLSHIFIPFLDTFINYLLDSNSLIIDFSKIEMNVLSSFIALFQKIGLALGQVNYFETWESKGLFLKTCDITVLKLLKKLEIKQKRKRKLTEIIISLNTLAFIETTLNGLQKILTVETSSISDSYSVIKTTNTYNLMTKDLITKLRISLQSQFDDSLNQIIRFRFKIRFSELFLNILIKINFEDLNLILQKQVLNTLVRQIFVKLSSSIINSDSSKIMIQQVDILYEYVNKTHNWVESNPFKTIRSYLSIFVVRPNELSLFVENFLKCSEERFSLLHVLKCLENKTWNEELYLLYKKYMFEKHNI